MKTLALLIALSQASCSWAFVRPPGAVADRCTESRLAPGFDVAGSIASFSMVAPFALVAAYFGGFEGSPALASIPVGFAVSGVLYALSARHGFRATRDCRAAHASVASHLPSL